MSRFISTADSIAARLRVLPAIAGMDVSVHRQGDLLSQVNIQFEKSAGTGCIVVKWLGGKNPDRKSSRLRMGGRYSVSLWTIPENRPEDAPPEDDLIEAIGEHLHGWSPHQSETRRLEVDTIDIVPDAPSYLVHEIIAEIARI